MSSNKEKIDVIAAKKAAYQRLFRTDDGQVVLEDLCRQYYDCTFNGVDLARQAGQRDVVFMIKQRMKHE